VASSRPASSHAIRTTEFFFGFLHVLDGELLDTETHAVAANFAALISLSFANLAAREQLQQSQTDYFRIVEALNVGVFEANGDGQFTRLNQHIVKMAGFDNAHEMMAVPASRFYADAADPQAVQEVLEREGELRNLVFEAKRKDGAKRWLSMNAVLERHDGETPRVVGIVTDITERVRLESNRRDMEVRYRALFEQAHEGFVVAALDGRILDANAAFARMHGYSIDSIKSLRIEDIKVHTDSAPSVHRSTLDRVIAGETVRFEVSHRRKDGSSFPLSITSQLIEIDGQKCVLALHQDISERKAVEQALMDSEKKYRSLFYNAGVGMFRTRVDGSAIIDFNDKYLAIFGFTREEMQGRRSTDFWADADERRAIIRRLRADGEVSDFECKMIDKQGRVHHCLTSARLDADEQMLEGSIVDLTERYRALQAVRESEAMLRESQRVARVGYYVFDIANDRWTSSEMLDAIFSIDREFPRDSAHWLQLAHPEDREAMANYLAVDVLTERKNFDKEYRIVGRGDHIVRWVHGRGHLEFDALGNPCKMFGTIQDITERKLTELALQNAQKLEALGVMAAGIAHDFNNLLTGIYGFVDIAREETNEAAVRADLSVVFESIDRARALTRQLLTFAKGGTPVKRIEHLFPFVQETAQFALSGSSVLPRFVVVDDIKPCHYDRHQIGQVIDNLVINAKQAMPHGGSITIGATNVEIVHDGHEVLPAGSYVQLTVEDTGVGIARDVLPKIFDPFFSTKAQGQGLGLATSHSIIRRHGGAIHAESEPGVGTRFRILLPVAEGSPEPPTPTSGPRRHGGGTVLVMDDERTIRRVVGAMLSRLGYSVIECETGEQAVTEFLRDWNSKRSIVAAIFDLTIPGEMGGLGAIAEVRKYDIALPVFVASGYAEDPVIARPMDYGFVASLRKPFRSSELAALLADYVKPNKI
jgi:PAS domain S-box-containing protein